MRMLAAVLTVLALAATGCSGDEGGDAVTTAESESTPSETSMTPATDDSSDTPEPATQEPAAEEPATEPSAAGPCSLLTDMQVNVAYGTLVGPGEPGRGQHDEDGVSYTSSDCEWEEDGTLELRLAVSTAEDFGGGLVCAPVSYLGDEGTPVKVAGAESATWLASEDPDEVEARLRVCTAEATLNLELDAATGTSVSGLRKQTVRLAAKAVAALDS